MTGLELAVGQSVVAGYLLALARVGGFVLAAPPFNTRAVPMQARVAAAVALALPLSTWTTRDAPTLDSSTLLLDIPLQLGIGVALGALVLVAVTTIQSVGDLIDTFGGFSVSQALDPMLLTQTSVMGRLHQLIAVTLIFVGDGHLVILQGLSRSFQLMPGTHLGVPQLSRVLTGDAAGMITAAFQIAAPVIAALFLADVALGLLTRAAPALNAFALAFPLKIVLTLAVVGLLLNQLPGLIHSLVEDAAEAMIDLAGGGGGGGG